MVLLCFLAGRIKNFLWSKCAKRSMHLPLLSSYQSMIFAFNTAAELIIKLKVNDLQFYKWQKTFSPYFLLFLSLASLANIQKVISFASSFYELRINFRSMWCLNNKVKEKEGICLKRQKDKKYVHRLRDNNMTIIVISLWSCSVLRGMEIYIKLNRTYFLSTNSSGETLKNSLWNNNCFIINKAFLSMIKTFWRKEKMDV